jgi:hypothetical protein
MIPHDHIRTGPHAGTMPQREPGTAEPDLVSISVVYNAFRRKIDRPVREVSSGDYV